jgi:hypothetical protein
MSEKYLLYIDILGFSDLVKADPKKIDTIYDALDRLNAHEHNAFKTIIFSDTILVFNITEPRTEEDHHYLVMFSCEFAQDLQKWCIKMNVQFRALLLYGEFYYQQRKNLESYYGAALIKAYLKEKELQPMGLFITKDIAHKNRIYKTVSFDQDVNFVFLTQDMERLSFYSGGSLPILTALFDDAHLLPYLWLELQMLHNLKNGLATIEDSRIRAKYSLTYQLYRTRYPELLPQLEATGFDLKAVNPEADWKDQSIDWWSPS